MLTCQSFDFVFVVLFPPVIRVGEHIEHNPGAVQEPYWSRSNIQAPRFKLQDSKYSGSKIQDSSSKLLNRIPRSSAGFKIKQI